MKERRATLQFVIKLLVSLGFLTALFYKWADLSAVWDGIFFLISSKPLIFTLACLLIFLNWWFEAAKWKILLQKIYPVKISGTIEYVLTGVTIGFITPGRSGEFAGRMILMPDKIRLESILLSIIGGIAQTIPAVAFGVFFSLNEPFHIINQSIDALLLSGALFAFVIIYFFINKIVALNPVRILLKSVTINIESTPDFKNNLWVLGLSFMRFGVYVVQYLLILHIAGIAVQESIAPVCWMLLLQSMSPAVAILDIGVRGSIAYWVFTQFGMFQQIELSAVFLIWFINLCVPALFGYLLILRWKKE
jgi:hypothetical protein